MLDAPARTIVAVIDAVLTVYLDRPETGSPGQLRADKSAKCALLDLSSPAHRLGPGRPAPELSLVGLLQQLPIHAHCSIQLPSANPFALTISPFFFPFVKLAAVNLRQESALLLPVPLSPEIWAKW